MIDVSRILNSPAFSSSSTITITRTPGSWSTGRFIAGIPQILQLEGIVLPLTGKDLDQLPEGDAIKGAVAIYCKSPLYTTQVNAQSPNTGNLSDELSFGGETYKILSSKNYSAFGYWKAMAVRKLGA